MYDVYMTHTRLLTPRLLARVVGGKANEGAANASDVVWDSRLVEPGAAFLALPGERHHGLEFMEEALAKGAAAIIGGPREHPASIEVDDAVQAMQKLAGWLRGGFPGRLIAVSGSVGKTTSKEALAHSLGWPATAGNLNTPPALTRFFWRLQPNTAGAVIELGVDRPGEMAELLSFTRPDLGLLTAIAPTHLQQLGSIEDVAKEKLALLSASRLRLAHVDTRRWNLPEGSKTYGFRPEADFSARLEKLDCQGTLISYRGMQLEMKALGTGAANAALAALAAAEMLELDTSAVLQRLETFSNPAHRLQALRRGGRLWLDDSYNASPSALAASLALLANCPGEKGVVLGTMRELGPEAEKWHLWAAKQVRQAASKALFVGEYAEVMARGWPNALAVNDAAAAADVLAQWSRGLDVVLIKGSRALQLESLLEVPLV